MDSEPKSKNAGEKDIFGRTLVLRILSKNSCRCRVFCRWCSSRRRRIQYTSLSSEWSSSSSRGGRCLRRQHWKQRGRHDMRKGKKMANTNPKRETRVSITWGNPVEVCCFDGPTWQSNNTSLACTEHGSWKWVRIRGWSVTQFIAVPFWHLTVWKSLLNVMCANFGWQL